MWTWGRKSVMVLAYAHRSMLRSPVLCRLWRPGPHPNGTTVLSVVIANDFQETVSPEVRPQADLSGLSAGNLMDIIREAGIVGMGGATFPTQ